MRRKRYVEYSKGLPKQKNIRAAATAGVVLGKGGRGNVKEGLT